MFGSLHEIAVLEYRIDMPTFLYCSALVIKEYQCTVQLMEILCYPMVIEIEKHHEKATIRTAMDTIAITEILSTYRLKFHFALIFLIIFSKKISFMLTPLFQLSQ